MQNVRGGLKKSRHTLSFNSLGPEAPFTNWDLIPVRIGNHVPSKVWDEFNNLSIPKLQRLHCWSLEMDK